jgi:hypothetical protein
MTRHVFDALIALACATLLTLALTSPVQANDAPSGVSYTA